MFRNYEVTEGRPEKDTEERSPAGYSPRFRYFESINSSLTARYITRHSK